MNEIPNDYWTTSARRRVMEIPESGMRDRLIQRLNRSSLAPGWEIYGPITVSEVEEVWARMIRETSQTSLV